MRAEPDRPGPARRPFPAHARQARLRARRQRALALLVALLVVVGAIVGLVVWATGGSTSTTSSGPRPAPGVAGGGAVPAIESGLLPWRLAAPISRTVVLPGTGPQAVILGGLNGSTSAQGVYGLDTSSGALSQLGTLAAGLHDAGGTVLGGRAVLFGGGSPATVATVQAFPLPSAGAPPARAAATVLGSLPEPRSDDAAVTIGDTAYVVGGYDGTKADPEVLATTDGSTFHDVAALPVPVRYPAVAVSGGKIYVFGGQAVTAAAAPVDDVQMVDPAARRASIVGHLPFPVAGAVAVNVGGHLYVAGGTSSTPQVRQPGVGTTQLSTGGGGNPGVGASGASTTAALSSDTVGTVWAFDPAKDTLLAAGQLQVPVAYASAAVVGNRAWIVGGEAGATQEAVVQMLTPNAGFGTAGASGAGSPYFGYQLLVADRGNNRLLLFDAADALKWTYPSATSPPDPLGFYFPDDAFFVKHGTAIISNQEENETIVQIAYPSGKIIWSYGHPKQTGTAPGYLHEPDDAYLLKNGQISVADAQNCRVLVLDAGGTVARQIGTDGVCTHNPPRSIGSPNGDTPLADGNLLVSEINGSWVSEWTLSGQMVWTTHVPLTYPSDPQQIGADRYLIADYARPGALVEFDRSGQVLYRYQTASGPGMLDHPSLSELLPSGAIMVNDDYSNRMVAIDPATGALVWQYGQTDNAGTGPGMLNTPDGFDLLGPGGSTPTHPATG